MWEEILDLLLRTAGWIWLIYCIHDIWGWQVANLFIAACLWAPSWWFVRR